MSYQSSATPYPLVWPDGWQRTGKSERKRARFKSSAGQVTVAVARARLIGQLKRIRVHSEVLSTNVELRLDGQPRSDRVEPDDVGVALYFAMGGQGRVLACDEWDTVGSNITAIAYHIEALRRIDRYGVGSMHQAFAGYAPRLQSSPLEWWLVLKIGRFHSTRADIDRSFKKLAAAAHPDAGGSHEMMARLTAAREAAYADITA